MPTLRIAFEPGAFYHMYTHAVGRDNLFRTSNNYLYFLKLYRRHVRPVAKTYAYCLMPNHIHFLIRIREQERLVLYFTNRRKSRGKPPSPKSLPNQISQQIGNCLNAYAKAYNKRYKRMGSLFVEAVKRKVVGDEVYLRTLIKYIHRNPVHHGFVRRPEDWQYSSYHTLAEAGRLLELFE